MPTATNDCTLLARTRQLLRSREHTYNEIYLATGLPPNWLALVATNRIAQPNVNAVVRLYEFLTGRQLQVH